MAGKVKRIVAGAAVFGLYAVIANVVFGYICLSMVFLGLPCPACGLTRAGLLLLSGAFVESFMMNPLFVPAFILMVCVIVCELRWRNKLKYLMPPSFGVAFAAIIIFIYRMVILFPYYEPMVVNENSVLHITLIFFRGVFGT